jgi:hypothetical protein
MAISTFDGPVRSLNGFYSQGPGNVITLGATATLSVATHGGKILLVPATCAIILPTIVATADAAGAGPGSDPNTTSTIGAVFQLFFNAISAGASAQTVTCGGSDAFVGSLGVIGTTVDYDAFASVTGTVITLNATTTGGAARGSQITLVALAANLWSVNGVLVGSGTPVTPFS